MDRFEARRAALRTALRRHGFARLPDPIKNLIRRGEIAISEGNRVELFAWGRDGLTAMLHAIECAQNRIELEVYIFRTDGTGQRFLDTLTHKARAGVRVRLLCDRFGSYAADDRAFDALRGAGGEVVFFRPARNFPLLRALRQRDHRKILIVDGRIGFTGGLNIGDEYMGSSLADDTHDEIRERGWRDTHLRLEGPVVRDLEAVFFETWFRAGGSDVAWEDLLREPPKACGDVRCGVLADGPHYRRRRVRETLRRALHAAKNSVRLASPYFIPGHRLLSAFEKITACQVPVQLLIAGKTHPALQHAAHGFASRLVARGVEVFEYMPVMMHAKVAVFDGNWAIVGTSNLDLQSHEHSYEVNIVIEGGAIPKQLSHRFDQDLIFARRIDRALLRQRSGLKILLDWIFAVLMRFLHA